MHLESNPGWLVWILIDCTLCQLPFETFPELLPAIRLCAGCGGDAKGWWQEDFGECLKPPQGLGCGVSGRLASNSWTIVDGWAIHRINGAFEFKVSTTP